ncbi:MAG: hypothetical protein AB1762_02315 [Gemmatimonadota bacterium]
MTDSRAAARIAHMPASNLARVAPVSPAPSPPPQRVSSRAAGDAPRVEATAAKRSTGALPVAIVAGIFAAINILGAPYYAADLATRVRHPWHAWLRPSGYIGQSAGILAVLIFFLLLLYPLRKRWKALAFTGSLAKWLDVHVAAALALPLLLTIHAAWRSSGVIGFGFAAMMIVWASGLIGRYVYTRIPRAKSGVELTRDEVAAQRRALVDRIAATTGLAAAEVERSLRVGSSDSHRGGLLAAARRMLTNDIVRWRMTRHLAAQWQAMSRGRQRVSRASLKEALKLASREISLDQQARMLEETRRVLHWWHVAHRPFAFTALIAVVIHVAVVVAVGATWFW